MCFADLLQAALDVLRHWEPLDITLVICQVHGLLHLWIVGDAIGFSRRFFAALQTLHHGRVIKHEREALLESRIATLEWFGDLFNERTLDGLHRRKLALDAGQVARVVVRDFGVVRVAQPLAKQRRLLDRLIELVELDISVDLGEVSLDDVDGHA